MRSPWRRAENLAYRVFTETALERRRGSRADRLFQYRRLPVQPFGKLQQNPIGPHAAFRRDLGGTPAQRRLPPQLFGSLRLLVRGAACCVNQNRTSSRNPFAPYIGSQTGLLQSAGLRLFDKA